MSTEKLVEGQLVFDPTLIQPAGFNRLGWTSKRLFRVRKTSDNLIDATQDEYEPVQDSLDERTEELFSNLPSRFDEALQVKGGYTNQRFHLELEAEEGATSENKIEFEGVFFKEHPSYFNLDSLIITKMSNSGAVAPHPYLVDVVTTSMLRLHLHRSDISCLVFKSIPNSVLDDFIVDILSSRDIKQLAPNTIIFSKDEQYEYFDRGGMFAISSASIAERLNKDLQEIVYIKNKCTLAFVFKNEA